MIGQPNIEKRSLRRVVIASAVGTTIGWYDFFLYGTAAALVFGELFFPTEDRFVGTLLAFVTFTVGFAARPIGGLIFGHFGDRIGRRPMLVATLLIMGTATCLIGLLPTYESIGFAAPVLLLLLRVIQGLALGGEWGGGVLMISEHTDGPRRGLFASLVEMSGALGFLASSGVLAVLNHFLDEQQFLAWGWRVPFLLSAPLILVGLYVRLRLGDSPQFVRAREADRTVRTPVTRLFATRPKQVVVGVMARLADAAVFNTFAVFGIAYLTQVLELPQSVGLNAILIGAAVTIFTVPLFGALSDLIGRAPVLLIGATISAAFAVAFFPVAETRQAGLIVATMVVGLAVGTGAVIGALPAFLAELFDTEVRYTGVSVCYQVGGTLVGATAPLIAGALLTLFDTPIPITIFVVICTLLTAIAAIMRVDAPGRNTVDSEHEAS